MRTVLFARLQVQHLNECFLVELFAVEKATPLSSSDDLSESYSPIASNDNKSSAIETSTPIFEKRFQRAVFNEDVAMEAISDVMKQDATSSSNQSTVRFQYNDFFESAVN